MKPFLSPSISFGRLLPASLGWGFAWFGVGGVRTQGHQEVVVSSWSPGPPGLWKSGGGTRDETLAAVPSLGWKVFAGLCLWWSRS